MATETNKRIQHYIEKDFEYRGFRCVIVAHIMGHRCGYVGLPESNLYYGVSYHEIPVNAHGGLTYGQHPPNKGYYPVETGYPVYWIGFDCAHLYDLPDEDILRKFGELNDEPERYDNIIRGGGYQGYGSSVRSQYYVETELKCIVDQLLDVEQEEIN